MSEAKLVPIPLFSPTSNRNVSIQQDSRLINGFVEKGQGDEGKELWVHKRPGLKLVYAWGAGAGLGIFNWVGHIYAIFGTTLYKDGVAKGTVDGSSSYTFTSCLGATPKLFLKNKSFAYNYDDVGGLVQVTDVNYPVATVRGCAYLDGTTYVLAPDSSINGDNLNDPTTWDPLNKLLVQIEPSIPECLAKQLTYVVALTRISTEVFYDAGNAVGSPLAPIQGSKLGVGTRAPESVVALGDDLAWLGTTSEANYQVMFMSKAHGDPISTPPVERTLASLDWTTTYAWSCRVAGHRFYVLTSKNSNLTFVFDLTMNTWYRWADTNSNYLPIVSSTYSDTGIPLLQHESNGSIYTLDPEQYDDYGNKFSFDLYTTNFDGGLRSRKTCASVEVVADQINTSVNISWSDDDYQTFSTPQSVNLNQERVSIQDGSSFRKRAYLIDHRDSTFLRIRAFNIMVSSGSF